MLAGQRMTLADRVAFTHMAATRQANLQDAAILPGPGRPGRLQRPAGRIRGHAEDLTNIEQAITAGTPVSKLPVTAAQWQQTGRYAAGGLLQRRRGGLGRHPGGRSSDQPRSLGPGRRHQRCRPARAAHHHPGHHARRPRHHPPPGRAGNLRPHPGREAAAGRDLPAAARRGRRRGQRGAAATGRPRRDRPGRARRSTWSGRPPIRAAVDEAKLRQGLNDVFRSLARRSQSLLHRQLTLLDQMERRASDPEALDDLFRLDHLTTRMRRHAEGLVILAGAPPGRGWSSPVRMVDVMRGAIAEVEDYARVSVATRSQAALAGSAVADVIHLLAELIENATTLSPPYTSVRVSGDTVANGFAIEVEDRGLGMSPPRLAEFNDRLANPPEFNPSDSEQLGLFVVSQLAKRHGIQVTLKASPYGGTAAIVLIPHHLVVTEEAFRAGLPGQPASVAMTQLTANGNHAGPVTPAALAGQGPGPGSPSSAAACPGWPRRPGSASPDRCAARRGSPRSGGSAVRMRRPRPYPDLRPLSARGTPHLAWSQTTCPGGIMASQRPRPTAAWCRTAPTRCRSAARRPPLTCSCRAGPSRTPARRPWPRTPGPGQARRRTRVAGPTSHPRRTRRAARRPIRARPPAWVWRRELAVPRDRRGAYPRTLPRQRFPVVSGRRPRALSGPAGAVPRLDPAQPARRARRPDRARARRPGWAGHSDDPGGLGAAGSGLRPALGASPRGRATSDGTRRIRPGAGPAQAGRERRHQGASATGQAGQPGPPAPRQPAAAPDHGSQRRPVQRVRARRRSARTMSALQRGWQEGRSQRMAGPAPGEPPHASSPAGAGPVTGTGPAASPPGEADQDSSPGGGAHDSTADEQAPGSSYGS